ncbi:Saccharopine dehydrogenase [Tieghemiomyces parasiticus]|uniref:Saccharopine dehydrogenase [NAD(+), L-lysine-forming] n=1 Tax=Tieghemiomyces parasiticus TaxID=78921 RepID=A0A9W8A4A8_9FUNG|nr:Saccharopine dehydrogenase [Tieghemiomyces parasiticus]
MTTTHLWLREETKPFEHRAALSPEVCRQLIAQGFQITAERSEQRIFDDQEYADAGCTVVAGGTWKTEAPRDAYVIGLKELPENDESPLPHTHIMFAHCFKNQGGWKDVLSRFDRGQGTLLDLEFLNDPNGRRVAAFGFHAGFAGAAVGIDLWCHQHSDDAKAPFPAVHPYPNEDALVTELRTKVAQAAERLGRYPRLIVIGALGRCGRGALDLARKAGIPEDHLLKWDMAETAKRGPFQEIADSDIFINCIYLSTPIPPFITQAQLDRPERRLSVIVDVSCDTTNPHNPIPFYNVNTTFDHPTLTVPTAAGTPKLEIVAIDHLPTMLPRESSHAFSSDLLPSLLELPSRSNARVWTDAEALFHRKVADMKAE